MKKISTSFVAMFLIIATLCSSAITTYAESITTNTIEKYLRQFETPYYGMNSKDFDINNDNVIDVFDLCLLKKKFLNNEAGVTARTVEKLQDWLLAKPESQLTVTVAEPLYLDQVNKADTEIIQNLLSNDFSFVDAKINDPTITLSFLGTDELILESLTFTSFTDSQDYDVIAENSGFAIAIKNGKYILVFKERIISSNENIGPAYAFFDLSTADKSIIPNLNESIENSDCESIAVDNSNNIAIVTFTTPNAKKIISVPISKGENTSGMVIYYNSEIIIFYNPDKGFRISFM